MFFAQDQTNLVTAEEFLMAQMQAQPEAHWAAVIDSAFDHDPNADATASPQPYQSGINCYAAEAPLNDLTEVAPWLVRLDLDESGAEVLRQLLGHCSGRPMFSLLASREPIRALAQRWFPLHMVHTPDKHQMLLRLADTRVLSNLPTVLQPAQWAAFAEPLLNWFYVNRLGAIAACELPIEGEHVYPGAIHLEQTQLNAMLKICEPDATIDFHADHMPELLQHLRPGQLHEYVADTFEIAKKCRIDVWADKVALVTAELVTQGRIRTHPELELLLRAKEWKPGKLGVWLDAKGLLGPKS